jgi:hypothetical protein
MQRARPNSKLLTAIKAASQGSKLPLEKEISVRLELNHGTGSGSWDAALGKLALLWLPFVMRRVLTCVLVRLEYGTHELCICCGGSHSFSHAGIRASSRSLHHCQHRRC